MTHATSLMACKRLMHECLKLEEDGSPMGRMTEKRVTIAQDFYDDMDEDNFEYTDEEVSSSCRRVCSNVFFVFSLCGKMFYLLLV